MGIPIRSDPSGGKFPETLRNLWNQGAEALEDAEDAVNDASDERATGGRGCGGNQQPGSCADAVLRLWDLGNLQCTICIF